MPQSVTDCIRFVMFETGLEEWPYATHGGTLFVVSLHGEVFGLTCKHVLADFSWSALCVSNRKYGDTIAGLSTIHKPSAPVGSAVGTDIEDIAVVRFSSDVTEEFFGRTAYVLDNGTYGTSNNDDRLEAHGALKQLSEITSEAIKPVFATLEATDAGAISGDPTLRCAKGRYVGREFDNVAGMSGSPVFNVTQGLLSGMVVRGGYNSGLCTLWYIDVFDIVKVLDAIISGSNSAAYTKTILRTHTRSS